MKVINRNKLLIYLIFFLSLSFFLFHTFFLSDKENAFFTNENLIRIKKAKDIMIDALDSIKDEKENQGIEINLENDPNKTGLIGNEYSIITTTMGHLDAKRTSVNPDTAALIALIFANEGLKAGDSVAIGSSASFPGLLLATLSACKALNLQPITIVSFGASQYGANEIEFTIIDMLKTLERTIGDYFKPDAISYGGNNDIADDLSEEARAFISKSIQSAGYSLIYEENFVENVKKRMSLYDKTAKTAIKMFVNIGGSISNIGTSPEVLNIKPGLNKVIEDIPPKNQRGVLFEFASRKTPILHLLYMKGLSIRYGLLWDPIPFQNDSHQHFYLTNETENKKNVLFILIFICTLFCFVILGKFLFRL